MEEIIEYSLNIDLAKKIPFDKYEKDFTFIVNDKEYQTSRNVADILSPKICSYHLIDEAINTFRIQTSKNTSDCDFSTFLSLISFKPVELTKAQTAYFRDIFLQLDNEDEYAKLCPKLSDEITIENVFERLEYKQTCMQLAANEEIEFISSHFFEIEESQIKNLDKDLIEQIIGNKNLKLEDEDSLLKFVIELYTNDKTYSSLFNYICFENVSNDVMSHFYSIFDINDMSNNIWRSLIERSMNSTWNSILNGKFEERYVGKIFKFSEEKKFNGIINYLTEKAGGNIHDKGIISVTSNNFSEHPKNLLDFKSSKRYCASGTWNIWICFDFKGKLVKITEYSINSIKECSSHHLKSWIIEISNDYKNWTQIDHQENCQKLNGTNLNATFKVQSNCFCRYVRLTNTAEPYGGNNLWFHSIEFYGSLKE